MTVFFSFKCSNVSIIVVHKLFFFWSQKEKKNEKKPKLDAVDEASTKTRLYFTYYFQRFCCRSHYAASETVAE